MSKTTRKFVFGLAVLPALLILLLVFEHLRGRAAWNNWKAAMEEAGELFETAALAPRATSMRENAAVDFNRLALRLQGRGQEFPPSLNMAAPGRAVLATGLKEWSSGKATHNWEPLERHFEMLIPSVAELHSLLQRPQWDFQLSYNEGFSLLLPHLASTKTVAQTLNASALWHLRSDRAAEATGAILTGLALTRLTGQEPLLISQLVRIAISQLTWNASWQAIHSSAVSEPQLHSLQQAWEPLDFIGPMARALEMERAISLLHYERAIASNAEAVQLLDSLNIWGVAPGEGLVQSWLNDFLTAYPSVMEGPKRFFYAPLWRFAWARQDQLRYARRQQEMIDVTRQLRAEPILSIRPYDAGEDTIPLVSFSPEPDSVYNQLRYPLSSLVFEANARTALRAVTQQTSQRLMLAGLALHRFHRRHGHWPEALAELLPEFLTVIPVDLDGAPLRYQPEADGTFLLYSVGTDGRDDGGDPHPRRSQSQSLHLWNTRDAVWPRPAH